MGILARKLRFFFYSYKTVKFINLHEQTFKICKHFYRNFLKSWHPCVHPRILHPTLRIIRYYCQLEFYVVRTESNKLDFCSFLNPVKQILFVPVFFINKVKFLIRWTVSEHLRNKNTKQIQHTIFLVVR